MGFSPILALLENVAKANSVETGFRQLKLTAMDE